MTQPVLILGAARSGTKYLRDILALAGNAAKVPYDINYIWRFGSDQQADDALPAAVSGDRKRFIRTQVHRLAGVRPGEEKVLFEKTVGNTLRVPFAAEVFPEAKFVHLVRDGRAVTESAMRQWSEPVDWSRLGEKLRGMPWRNFGYAAWFAGNFLRGKLSGRGGGKVWGPRYPGIAEDVDSGVPLVEICARQWSVSVRAAREGLASIAPERQITIRYEELVAGTAAVEEVARFCGLEDIGEMLEAHLARVDRRADNKWKRALTEDQKRAMLRVTGPLLAELGYLENAGAAS